MKTCLKYIHQIFFYRSKMSFDPKSILNLLKIVCIESVLYLVTTISISTKRNDQIVDITEVIETHLKESPQEDGFCLIFVAHTTCAITTADLDPGTDLDFIDALRRLLPHIAYRHPHDPSHTPDHILSSIIGPSVVVPFRNRRLLLGTWQRIVLVELSGPRRRTLHISFQ